MRGNPGWILVDVEQRVVASDFSARGGARHTNAQNMVGEPLRGLHAWPRQAQSWLQGLTFLEVDGDANDMSLGA